MTDNDNDTTIKFEGEVCEFDVSNLDEETIKGIKEKLHTQVVQLARMGVVDLFGQFSDGKFAIGVPHKISGGVYSADVGQLIAFVIGATAANETAAMHLADPNAIAELLSLAVKHGTQKG